MTYVLSSLGNYTRQNADKLLAAAIGKSVTAKRLMAKGNVRTGIKSSDAIGRIETTVVYQDGAACGTESAGSTTISQRILEVGKIKVVEKFCEHELEPKFTQLALKKGDMDYDTLAFEEDIVNEKVAIINNINETALWQGDKNSGDANLNKFDGLVKLIFADPTVKTLNYRKGTGTVTAVNSDPTVTGTGTDFLSSVKAGDKIYSGTTLLGVVDSVTTDTSLELVANSAASVTNTAWGHVPKESQWFAAPHTAAIDMTNIIAVVQKVRLGLPKSIFGAADKPVLWMGLDLCLMLKLALFNANMYHYKSDANVDELEPFIIPGIDLECQPTPGLDELGYMFVTRDKNLFLGTDMQGAENQAKTWYNDDTEEVKIKFRFKLGTQFAFGKEISAFRRLA